MIFHILLLLLPISAQQSLPDRGLKCQDHPLPIQNPILLHSWSHTANPRPVENTVYLPRYKRMQYRPTASPNDTSRYKDLDLFFSTSPTNRQIFATLFTQRPAKIYLFAHAARPSAASPQLPGWSSDGFAERAMPDRMVEFGVFERRDRFMPRFAYVFSKFTSADRVDIPDSSVVKRAAGNAVLDGDFHLRIAEADGSASLPPPRFKGRIVRAGRPCPSGLHAAWAVEEGDETDADTQGVLFNSWHPTWDPCYWCTYGHEHGSSPLKYLDYRPRYGLVARKNDLENESDSGFKDFIFEQDGYIVNINIHSQTSLLRRAATRLHTIAIVIVDARTKELLVELRHKGDFGFLAARKRGKNGDGFIPLRPEDEAEQRRQQGGVQRLRALNVINVDNLDGRFQYRDPPSVLFGTYEDWETLPICSTGSPDGLGILMDIQTPGTALRTATDLQTRVQLGRRPEGRRFYMNTGLQRTLRVRLLRISAGRCRFEGGRRTNGGFFYTDATGTRLLDGPGKGAVRQFVKRGVDVEFTGSFGQSGRWLGLYGFRDFSDRFFFNVNFGIDPKVN